MKKKRNLTFGYCISNGRIVFCEKESETVRKIFDLYLSGQPLGRIAELLTRQNVPYSDMTSEWNKSRVSRILSTEKYVGRDVYPQIISEKDFNTANSIKSSRKGVPRTDIKLFCSECGKRMHSVNTRGKLYWKCSDCNCNIHLTLYELSARLNSMYEKISGVPSLLIPERQVEEVTIKPDLKLYELRKELSRQDFDQDEILAKIFDIAEIDYNASAVGSEISEEIIRKQIEQATADGKLPIEFIKERTEKVCFDRDGCITMRMTTSADISERSHIYGSHKNTEENGHFD